MPTTNFGSALKTGSGIGDGADSGFVVLAKSANIVFDATLVQSATFTVPPGSQLLDIQIDTTTAFNSATSATLTVGTAAAGTQYVTGVDVKTTGREANVTTTAQAAAMADVGTNTSVVATVTSVGQPTAGQARVTIFYSQKT